MNLKIRVAIIISVMLALAIWIYRPKWIDIRKLKTSVKTSEADLGKVRKEKKVVEEFEEEKEEFQKEVEVIEGKIPLEKKGELPELLRELEELAKESGTKNLFFKTRKKEQVASDISEKTIYELPLEMNMDCKFKDLAELLKKLHNFHRLITIEKLSIARNEKKVPLLEVALKLSGYCLSLEKPKETKKTQVLGMPSQMGGK